MSSPLEAFLAAERFIDAAEKLDPRVKVALTKEQTTHVVQIMQNMSFNKDDATDLLCELARTPSIFSADQRQTIATAVRASASKTRSSSSWKDFFAVERQAGIWMTLRPPVETRAMQGPGWFIHNGLMLRETCQS